MRGEGERDGRGERAGTKSREVTRVVGDFTVDAGVPARTLDVGVREPIMDPILDVACAKAYHRPHP